MKKSGYLLIVALLLFSVPLVAQDSGGNIAAIYCTKVQPGKGAQFEAAAKEYTKWRAEKNDSWAWLVWNITTGPDVGSYCWGSFGHTWADFDNPGVSEAEDTAHWQATVAAYERGGEATIWSFIPDVSKPLEGDVPMYSIIAALRLLEKVPSKYTCVFGVSYFKSV